MRYIQMILVALCLFILSGCVAQRGGFDVGVDSIANPDGKKRTYLLYPGDKEVRQGDLQYQEYAAHIRKVLASKGFRYVDHREEVADLAIYLSYGISGPQEQRRNYQMPVFGTTGGSATTRGVGIGSTVFTSTTATPNTGIVGWTSGTKSRTVYDRYFVLDAYDIAASAAEGEMVPVWRTVVTSTGSSGDLRYVFPALAVAARPYIGTNTGKKIEVTQYNDESVQALRGAGR